MATALSRKMVAAKIDMLAEQRNDLIERKDHLQSLVDDISELLHVGTSWLRNDDGANNFTFTDINKMIEDKLVFLSGSDVSVGYGMITSHQESATRPLPPASISTDQPLSASCDQTSVFHEEMKTIMNQVKVMQDAMCFLSTSSEKLSEKQLATDKLIESLSDKYSKIEQTKIKEVEIELKSICEKQKKAAKHQDKRMTSFEKKIQSVTDLQSDIIENCHQQQSKIKDYNKENERFQTQSQQMTQDLSDVLENIQELNSRISVLENQAVTNTQMEALVNRAEFLETSSEVLSAKFEEYGSSLEELTTRTEETLKNLSAKFEEHGSSLEAFTRRTEETFKDMSSVQGREFEQLQKFEQKISALEKNWCDTTQGNKKLYQDVETKYKMVCQVIADRLLPLERLRDIFNDKMDVRKENLKKSSSANLPSTHTQPKSVSTPVRDPQTEAARRAAAEAAQARMEAKLQTKQADSMVIQRARMKREMEAEKKRLMDAEGKGAAARAGSVEIVQDCAPVLESVLFRCSDIGPQCLTKSEMEIAIHKFLLDNYEDEPEMTSAIMIHTLNNNKEKVKVCIETFVKYLDNIINNPTEEKFWKIRQSNKVFQEKVAGMKGTEEFLLAAGFSLKNLPFEEGEACFYVFDSDLAKDVERLENMKDVLLHAEPLWPELDRDIKVFYPSNCATKFNIPEEFYNVTPAELKKEQQRREEATEKLGMLRTKAMREKDEQRELRKYRYTLIRIRFPDGVKFQGVFKSSECISSVFQFVRENLVNDFIPFYLVTGTGQKLQEEDATLAELLLAPAAVLNFSWDAEILREAAARQGQAITKVHLKPELMAQITDL